MRSDANLLLNLFTWRPRDSVTPGENFLTEAFVHVLRVNAAFRLKWLMYLLGEAIDPHSAIIATRAVHIDQDSETTLFPDVEIRGQLEVGTPFHVLVEIKWGANYDFSQLQRYDRLLETSENPHLVFLCARSEDYQAARKDAGRFVHAKFSANLWESVFDALQETSTGCPFSKELLGFMSHHGLSPGRPITRAMVEAYVASKPLFSKFHRYAEKLLHEFDWTILPSVYQDTASVGVRDRFGRVAVEFAPKWNGAITIGFMYDNRDHAIPFAGDTPDGIDLIMRIEASPQAKGRDLATAAIRRKAASVRAAGGVVRLNSDGVNGNRHTLLIAHRSLNDFLDSSVEGDQLHAMYGQVKAWSEALFSDGTVGAALAQLAHE